MNFFNKIFSRQGEKNERLMALDVGTEILKVLVFYVDKKKKEIVIEGVGREKHKSCNMRGSFILDAAGVVSVCKKAMEKAVGMANKIPQKVIVGIAGNLAEIKTETVYYERKDPSRKMDLSEFTDIMRDSQKEALGRIQKKLIQKNTINKIELVDVSVVDFCIDGYRITNPLGFKGRKIKISISNFYVSVDYLNTIREIVDRLGLGLMKLACESQAVSKIINAQNHSPFGEILIDIGGSATNITFIRDKSIENTKTFSIGGESFTGAISRKLNLNFYQAEDLKIRYSQNKLENSSGGNIEKILRPCFETWLLGIKLSLKEFSNSELLPSRILVYGGSSQFPQLGGILNDFFSTAGLPFAKKPEIIFVGKNHLNNITDKTKALVICQDLVSIGLSGLILDFDDKKNTEKDIFEKIIGKQSVFYQKCS